MAFNGSGTYNLPAGNPVVTGTTISSSTTNTTNSDIATALTNCITRDGQSTPSANLPMNAKKLTGLAAGTSAGDSVRYEQVLLLAGGTMTGAITFAAGQTVANLASGSAGTIPYQSASGTTAMLAAGTSGQVLQSNGASAPSWVSAASGLSAATQAEMETATSNTVAVTPLATKWSPAASKAWIKINVTGGTPTNSISYNVASIADTATGKCTVTLTTGFSSSNYVVLCSVDSGGTITSTPDVRITSGTVFFAEITNTSNVPIDPREYFFATFGDQS